METIEVSLVWSHLLCTAQLLFICKVTEIRFMKRRDFIQKGAITGVIARGVKKVNSFLFPE
jgi:hypothetical protein